MGWFSGREAAASGLFTRLTVLAVLGTSALSSGCGEGQGADPALEDTADPVLGGPQGRPSSCVAVEAGAFEPQPHVGYFIQSRSTGLLLEIEGARTDDGAPLVLGAFRGRADQQFDAERAEGGRYFLRARHSRRTLNVRGGSLADGAVLQQWDGPWDENRFVIRGDDTCALSIVNKKSRACLTAVGPDASNPSGRVVQRPCATAGAARDAQTFALVPAKKGFDIVSGRGDWSTRLSALSPAWYYSWGSGLDPATPPQLPFVPMIWGFWGASEGFRNHMEGLRALGEAGVHSELLGFNEPDGAEQANLSVEKALEAWPYLESTGLRLGSPAAVHADGPWMQAFMRRVAEIDARVDFVTVHWYGGTNVDDLVRFLTRVHDLYQRPIWITEFAPADWSARAPDQNRISDAATLRFMRAALPRLDALPFVERYAWFSFGRQSAAGTSSALFEADASLSPLGKYYSAYPFAD